MIPYANHNQSPRNQLSCSQSKQGLSVYSTAFQNRFDNQVHVLGYGQAPLVRTLYYDYLADGQMGYGHNLILAMGSFTGYNQDDGILMNGDSVARGLFRSTFYRSYEAFEEDDPMTHGKTRIGNPVHIPGWTSLRPGLDYSKLDERGIVRVGEMVDETSVLVGMYLQGDTGDMRDASKTAQVWSRGRVEKVSVTVNNMGLAMVKVRVVQERVPELGDKFCLTPDHEVLTKGGWVAIDKVTTEMKVAQRAEYGCIEYITPSEIVSFAHTGPLYRFGSKPLLNGFPIKHELTVSSEHKLYVRDNLGVNRLIQAKDLYTSNEEYSFVGVDGTTAPMKYMTRYDTNPFGNSVHCITVPSGVFLVKHKDTHSKYAVWTGNSNRHGQKGTIGMLLRGHDMPRTAEGIPVDMIMNPHAIPSRMTVAQLIEALVGKAAAPLGTVGNGTLFMNDGNPVEAIGAVLRDHLGMEPFGEELMYDGMSGQLIPTQMFIGNVYTMRLKHMPDDKWNARAEGRREQRTHQPTGGRGAQGGLRIGEMERDAILGHGISDFLRESIMKRADGYETIICNGCGTIPIYNEKEGLTICPMCDGPLKFIGETANTLEILPPMKRSVASFSKVEIPYAFKVLDQEMNAYLNMGMRVLTEKDVKHFRGPPLGELAADEEKRLLETVLPERILLDTEVPEMIAAPEEPEVRPEDLTALGLSKEEEEAAAAPPAIVQIPAQAQANTFTIDIPSGIPTNAVPAPEPLHEDTMEDVPFAEGPPPPNYAPTNSVNVQTSSQPVLVIPMNIGRPAAPTEVYQPPMPGAPTTFAVDTSDQALKSLNIPSTTNRANPNTRRSVSPGTPRTGSVVNVQRQGSVAPPANNNANVRVNVTKQG